jgi:hypothetical protein
LGCSKSEDKSYFWYENSDLLPDDIFVQADRLARRLKKSRSQLYRQAVAEYLARHDPDAVTSAMDKVVGQIKPRSDRFVSVAARRILHRTEW